MACRSGSSCRRTGGSSSPQICLRQLRRTCDALADAGTRGDRGRHRRRREPRHRPRARVRDRRARQPLPLAQVQRRHPARAVTQRFNPRPADYVVPCGSRRLGRLAALHSTCRRRTRWSGSSTWRSCARTGASSTVRLHQLRRRLRHPHLPAQVMARSGYRPADEDRRRGCDTSMLVNLRTGEADLRVEHRDIDPRQIVDWKSPAERQPVRDRCARRAASCWATRSRRCGTSIRRRRWTRCRPTTALQVVAA